MRDLLNVLGFLQFIIGVVGGFVLFLQLGHLGIDPAMRVGVAVGTALSCWVTGAVLMGMAEGLRLLEAILSWVQTPEEQQDGAA